MSDQMQSVWSRDESESVAALGLIYSQEVTPWTLDTDSLAWQLLTLKVITLMCLNLTAIKWK